VHPTLDLGPADVESGRIPRTTPTRTLCDIASRLDPSRLEAVLDHAELRNQIWRPQLRWRSTVFAGKGDLASPRWSSWSTAPRADRSATVGSNRRRFAW
jgi:hypothetical protein